MEKDNSATGKYSGFFSKKLKAGKRRTYFFDVRSTKQGDFFLTITESKKKFEGDGYDSHKIFLYKEDFKRFLEALNETVDYIKTELMPDYDYDAERPAPKVQSESHTSDNHHSLPYSTPPVSDNKPEHKAEENHKDTSSVVNDPTTTSAISDDEQVDWN